MKKETNDPKTIELTPEECHNFADKIVNMLTGITTSSANYILFVLKDKIAHRSVIK